MDLKNRLSKAQEEYINIITYLGPIIYSAEAIEKLKNAIETKYKSGELPPDIEVRFLKELLTEGTCICGADLNDPDRRKNKTV